MAKVQRDRAGYERSDVDPRLLLAVAAAAAIFLVAAPGVLWAVYTLARREPVAPVTAMAPPPRLQTDPPADLRAFRDGENARLTSYGWVDRDKGVVHIPIDRAIRLTVERGLNGWHKP